MTHVQNVEKKIDQRTLWRFLTVSIHHFRSMVLEPKISTTSNTVKGVLGLIQVKRVLPPNPKVMELYQKAEKEAPTDPREALFSLKAMRVYANISVNPWVPERALQLEEEVREAIEGRFVFLVTPREEVM